MSDRTQSDTEDLSSQQAWFEAYVARIESMPAELPLRCPCCESKTLTNRGDWEVCPVCFWEDDGQDDHDADEIRGGPNGNLSLSQARDNYRRVGACDGRIEGGSSVETGSHTGGIP